MIKLKTQINKSATMRELRKEAEKGYEHSWQPELQVEAFMKGAEALLNLLHLPRVSNPLSCDGCKYNNTLNDDLCGTCGDTYKNKAT